jgi:hypothetical protein
MSIEEQLAESVFGAKKMYVERAIGKERRGRERQLAELARRLAAAEEKNASLERRASRHADHLSRLEDRVRKAEGKA